MKLVACFFLVFFSQKATAYDSGAILVMGTPPISASRDDVEYSNLLKYDIEAQMFYPLWSALPSLYWSWGLHFNSWSLKGELDLPQPSGRYQGTTKESVLVVNRGVQLGLRQYLFSGRYLRVPLAAGFQYSFSSALTDSINLTQQSTFTYGMKGSYASIGLEGGFEHHFIFVGYQWRGFQASELEELPGQNLDFVTQGLIGGFGVVW